MNSYEKREIFHNEMGKIIFYFNEILNKNKIKTLEQEVLFCLVKKIISNSTSANILVLEGYFNEAKIILRSAIETVVLIAYLVSFPEKTTEYIETSQILRLKNNFISYKTVKTDGAIEFNGVLYTQERLISENKNCFETLPIDFQKKILNEIGIKYFEINEITERKIEKYFKNLKPFFQSLEGMCKAIGTENLKIEETYTIRDILFPFYNESSQIAHNSIFDWRENNKYGEDIEYIFHYFMKVTLFLNLILKERLILGINNETRNDALEMKSSIKNLEKLIYGKELEH